MSNDFELFNDDEEKKKIKGQVFVLLEYFAGLQFDVRSFMKFADVKTDGAWALSIVKTDKRLAVRGDGRKTELVGIFIQRFLMAGRTLKRIVFGGLEAFGMGWFRRRKRFRIQ